MSEAIASIAKETLRRIPIIKKYHLLDLIVMGAFFPNSKVREKISPVRTFLGKNVFTTTKTGGKIPSIFSDESVKHGVKAPALVALLISRATKGISYSQIEKGLRKVLPEGGSTDMSKRSRKCSDELARGYLTPSLKDQSLRICYSQTDKKGIKRFFPYYYIEGEV